MNHWLFLFRLRHKQVLQAIADSERLTSGEIRVCISHRKSKDPMADAQSQFDKLGMAGTTERNGILFFIAPRSRNFAIVGDEAIHSKCSDEFWCELTAILSEAFSNGKLTDGLVSGVRRAGELLALHFPKSSHDHNELPDEIVRQ